MHLFKKVFLPQLLTWHRLGGCEKSKSYVDMMKESSIFPAIAKLCVWLGWLHANNSDSDL